MKVLCENPSNLQGQKSLTLENAHFHVGQANELTILEMALNGSIKRSFYFQKRSSNTL